MKTKRLEPTFGPETRFELSTNSPATLVVPAEELERLSSRLLLERLSDVPETTLRRSLTDAASEAVALAAETFVPLLVFPALFEEKAYLALRTSVSHSVDVVGV